MKEGREKWEISRDEARKHPMLDVLLRAVGVWERERPLGDDPEEDDLMLEPCNHVSISDHV